jgi:predicted nucleic acid-binding protein
VILVDTSVWIEHFRSTNPLLSELLDQEQVFVHPFVLGEIACSNLTHRQEIIALMRALPTVQRADDHEILFFIEQRALMGRGIGLIDIHLLASCLMQPCSIWTADKRLNAVAQELGAAFDPTHGGHAR